MAELIPWVIALTIPGLPKMPNELLTAHWRKSQRNTRDWHLAVRAAIGRDMPPVPLSRAKIHFVRHSSSEPDYDGLVGSFKPVLDGLIKARVILDDNPENVELSYAWMKAPRNKGHIGLSVLAQ